MSHKVCICLSFLQCVFSNEPSNALFEWRRNCIGCICATFLCDELSSVTLVGLHERTHINTGCIFLLFANGFFKCLLKWGAWLNTKTCWLHMFNQNIVLFCFFKCLSIVLWTRSSQSSPSSLSRFSFIALFDVFTLTMVWYEWREFAGHCCPVDPLAWV